MRECYFPEDGFMWLAIFRRSYLEQRQAQRDLFQVTPGEAAYRRRFRAVFAPLTGRLP